MNLKKNNEGIAILMVLTAITIMTTLLINFSFDAKLNRIKSINIQDRAQARLNAESGVELSMARLRLYKAAYNYLEGNKSAKDFVSAQIVNQIWQFPFFYPIPIMESMGEIQKSEINDFSKEMFMPGGLQIDIQNQSLKFNINMLRFSLVQKYNQENDPNRGSDRDRDDDKEIKFEDQIVEALRNGILSLERTDEVAYNYYRTLELEKLVAYLKYYISDQNSYEDDLFFRDAQRDFEDIGLSPKYAPMASFEEMYLLPEWDEFLINIIKNQFTVHPNVTIDLNEINADMLKLLIPEISQEEIEAFFAYRDDQKDPKFFNKLETFKSYIVSSAGIMDSGQFDERFGAFQKLGIEFGPAPTLFKIKSVGVFGGAEYTILAYVTMPSKPKRDKIDVTKITDPEKKKSVEAENQRIEAENKKNILLEPRITEIYSD